MADSDGTVETAETTETVNGLTRRRFVARAAGTAGAAALAAGILPVHAGPTAPRRGGRQNDAANDTLVLGLIGCGGMGASNMRSLLGKKNVTVAAVCDVDEARIPKDVEEVEKRTGRKPDVYKDYRRILDRKDIDAVIIGTPDHWHALNLIHACEAGKDSYCEKPISHNIVEAKAMDAAARRFGRVVQVGTWQRSGREFTDAVAYVRSGKLGKVTLVRSWKTDPFKAGRGKAEAPPSSLDYDLWTGPAQMVPYASNHVHFGWRWFLNYGSGMTGDWGVHMMDIGLLGMSRDTDLVMPTEVTSYGGRIAFPDDDRTAPDTVQTIMRFRDPDFVLHWQTGRDHAGRPDHGTEFVAADGKTLRVWRGGWSLTDAQGKELPKEEAGPVPTDHWQDWVDCVRTRQSPRSNLSSMAQSTIVCHLANAALLAGETVRWDKAKMDIVGKAGRDTLPYRRDYRKGYKLPMYRV